MDILSNTEFQESSIQGDTSVHHTEISSKFIASPVRRGADHQQNKGVAYKISPSMVTILLRIMASAGNHALTKILVKLSLDDQVT